MTRFHHRIEGATLSNRLLPLGNGLVPIQHYGSADSFPAVDAWRTAVGMDLERGEKVLCVLRASDRKLRENPWPPSITEIRYVKLIDGERREHVRPYSNATLAKRESSARFVAHLIVENMLRGFSPSTNSICMKLRTTCRARLACATPMAFLLELKA